MPLPAIESPELLQSIAISLGLGLLVGLQREWEHNPVAGIRTFALASLFGALSGVMGQVYGGWVVAAALVAFSAMIVPGYIASLRQIESDPGLTTEIAMLITFSTGVIAVMGYSIVAIVVAASVMVLLQSKKSLHQLVHAIGENDLREIARLVLIGLVILPVLPNKSYGYEGVLNPFAIWLMVVLIVGISLAAYLASKFLGNARGIAIAGILGGLISSTATTASISRRSKEPSAHALPLAVIALVSSSVVFVRVIAEVMLVGPKVIPQMLPPLLAVMAVAGIIAAVTHRFAMKSVGAKTEESPPSELKSAVVFGLLYVLVLLAVSYARKHFGNAGLYTVAAISGLTDMDAITLSTASLANKDQIDPSTAWRVILTGGMANLVFKSGLVLAMGSPAFIRPVLIGFAITFAACLAVTLLWP
jgi:uncharacterized membrane protein (DUF4010 family)